VRRPGPAPPRSTRRPHGVGGGGIGPRAATTSASADRRTSRRFTPAALRRALRRTVAAAPFASSPLRHLRRPSDAAVTGSPLRPCAASADRQTPVCRCGIASIFGMKFVKLEP